MSEPDFSSYFEKERSSTWNLLRLREAIWKASDFEWSPNNGTVTIKFKDSVLSDAPCELACLIAKELRARDRAVAEGKGVCHE